MIQYIQLKAKLDELYSQFHASYLYSDPLKYLHKYEKPIDQELVGIIVSSLAYGRVEKIFDSVETVLEIIGLSPSDYILSFDPSKEKVKFDDFVHRFNKGEDLACLIWFLKQILIKYGSLGNLFKDIAADDNVNMKDILTKFTDYILSLDSSPFYGSNKLPDKAGVRYFFPTPLKGSSCKRLNLFMRWMVRENDGLDLGLWDFIPPSKLILPLDTHLASLTRYLGFTNKKSANWKVAEEVTEHLKQMSPEDPLRYDFSLCRLGILDICPKKKIVEKCSACSINEFCTL